MDKNILREINLRLIAAFIVGSFPFYACADWRDKLGMNAGITYEYGNISNHGMGLSSRSIGSEVVQILPGYRIDPEWLIGIDFQYRFQQQLSSLDSSGGTNLATRGYLLGVGAKYILSNWWSFQATLDFLGAFNFDHQTKFQENDGLRSPIGVSIKGQYYLRQDVPISIDGTLNYVHWTKFRLENADLSQPTNQWTVGVGITYHLLSNTSSNPPSNSKQTEEDVSLRR